MSKKGVDLTLIVASLLLISSILAISSFKNPTITGAPIGVGGGGGAECTLCYPWTCYNSVSCSNKCGGSQSCVESRDICCDLCPANDYTCIETNQTTSGLLVSSGGNDLAAYCTDTGTEQCDGFDNDCDGIIDELCDKDQDAYCDNTMWYRKDQGAQILTDRSNWGSLDVYASKIVYLDNRSNKIGLYVKNLQDKTEMLINQELNNGGYLIQGPGAIWKNSVAWLNRTAIAPTYQYDVWLTNITNGQRWKVAHVMGQVPSVDIYENYITTITGFVNLMAVQRIDVTNPNSPIITNITTATLLGTPHTPYIHKNYIVWHNNTRPNQYDVFAYNTLTSTTQRITSSNSNRWPDVYNGAVTYTNETNTSHTNGQVLLYNLSSGTLQEITSPQYISYSSRIHGNYIAYSEKKFGNDDIFVYHTRARTEIQVSNSSGTDFTPAIYDRLVVWGGGNETHPITYYRDLSSGPICYSGDCNDANASINPSGTEDPTCNGVDEDCDGMVDEGCDTCLMAPDQDADAYKKDVWMENPVATDSSANEDYSSTYKDIIVYQSDKTGYLQIYMYNVTSGITTQVTSYLSEHKYPRIYKDIIVYRDDRNHNWPTNPYYDIFMYNITSGAETRITSQTTATFPNIYENNIIWMDYRNHATPPDNWDVYLYDLNTHTERRITTQPTAYFTGYAPDIFAHIITWSDQRNDPNRNPPNNISKSDIYIYDLDLNQESKISTLNKTWSPTTDGNYVAYVGNDLPGGGSTTIYLYDLMKKKESSFTEIPQGTSGLQLRQGNVAYNTQICGGPCIPNTGQRQEHVKNVNTNIDKKLTTDNPDHQNPSIWNDVTSYTHWNGTMNAYDVYYVNISQTCGDCNDNNNSINPGMTEECYNGVDDDCDGLIDEGCLSIECLNSNDSDQDTYKADFYNEKVASDNSATQAQPQVYKNLIVYNDYRNGNGDIYLYDINTQLETQIINNPTSQVHPDIWKDGIVFTNMSANYDIYLHNLTTGINTRITTNAEQQYYPAIWENVITWIDRRNSANPLYYDIYSYDLKTSIEKRITTNPTATQPAGKRPENVDNNIIVWSDNRSGNQDIYLYDLAKSKEVRVTNKTTEEREADVYGNTVVWEEAGVGIWKATYTPFSGKMGTATQILNSSSLATHSPRINGQTVTYQDFNGSDLTTYEIYTYDLSTSQRKKITKNKATDFSPAIYADLVTYEKRINATNDDIYYINLSQEIICGDCEDGNASVNTGIVENVSMTNDSNTCQNNIDDDCDGLIDCLDDSCDDSPPCAETCIPSGPTEIICNDNIDNDCDNLRDCEDSDCVLSPDCSGNATLYGYVFDDQGWKIDLATITGYPPYKPIVTTFTDINGFYNYTVPIGTYSFKADKFGYDPDIDELTLLNGTDNEHNFTLHNATCHTDCTNSEGRCNKDCEGYTYQGDTCHFANQTVANACNDKRKGTTQTLQTNENWYLLVDCCEGQPYYQWKPKLTITGNMEDLYKLTSIVSIGGDPAKLHVNTWRK